MPSSLRESYNSEYVRQSNRLTGRRHVVEVWVEDEYDVPFWNDLLGLYPEIDFRLTPYRRKSLNKGEGDILKYVQQLGPNLIACVDSDYDYLLPECSEAGRKLSTNPYVLHTITYAIENWNCHPSTLNKLCINATLSDPDFDFEAFFADFSRAVYPLLLWSLLLRREKMNGELTFDDFRAVIDIPFNVTGRNSHQAIETVARNVNAKSNELAGRFPGLKGKLGRLAEDISVKGVEADNCFLFINGHILEDLITQRLLTPLCKRTVRQHIESIFSSHGTMKEKERKKAHYDNITRRSLSVLLASNFDYKAHSRIYKDILLPSIEQTIERLKHGGR